MHVICIVLNFGWFCFLILLVSNYSMNIWHFLLLSVLIMQSLVGHPHCSLCWETTSILLALRDIWNLRILQKLLLTFAYFKFLRCLINEPVEKEASMVQLVHVQSVWFKLPHYFFVRHERAKWISQWSSNQWKKHSPTVPCPRGKIKYKIIDGLRMTGLKLYDVRRTSPSRSNVIFVSFAKILHIVQVTE